MNHLLTVLFSVVIAFGLCFCGFTKEKLKQKYLLIFLIIFSADQIFVRLPFIIPQIDIIGGQYNWTGKALAAVFSIIIILILKKHYPLDFAFTFKQNPRSVKTVLSVLSGLVIIQFLFLYFTSAKHNITWEDHLFQSTLPGISEEIMFRGILLGLLNGVFDNKHKILGAYFGWGTVVTSVLFALWHGLNLDKDFHLHIYFLSMIFPLIFGFISAWARERTKSLLVPVIFHNVINELSMITVLVMSFK
jgi:membrane protease YdiL (CAAX protease family)